MILGSSVQGSTWCQETKQNTIALLLCSCIDITRDVSHIGMNESSAIVTIISLMPRLNLGWVVGAPTSGAASAPSLTCQVPGMRATSNIQVAVKTIPWPT